MSACEHFVQIYDDDRVFLDTLEGFIAGGLLAGESGVVIATPKHLPALEARLERKGIDVAAAKASDQYIPLEAEETLSLFMTAGWPDDRLFERTIADILERAMRGGRRVRAFGEMVAVLWEQGHHAATVRLEHLWSELCRDQKFALFCAYPKAGFTENANDSIAAVCQAHTHVVA
jgi:hypothetical protein